MRKLKKMYSRLKKYTKHFGFINLTWTYLKKIARGYRVYKRILKKYGETIQIYIEHYPGTGDIYITCALFKSYCRKYNRAEPYVVTIIGRGAIGIIKLLEIENFELLTQKESDALIAFYRFMGNRVSNITILHYAPIEMHTRIIDNLAGFKNLDFMSMYLSTVFQGMSWNDAISFPKFEEREEIQEYFDEKGLIWGKTVVLFPFANTVEPLSWKLWEELARRLREIGFSVCTNSEADDEIIPGTCRVFVPYKHLCAFVEAAGYVVGVRSGVFDIIASTSCFKFILYPSPNFYKFGVGTIMDYFSLLKMGIGKKVIEYGFERIYDLELSILLYYDICNIATEEPLLSAKEYDKIKDSNSKHHIIKQCLL